MCHLELRSCFRAQWHSCEKKVVQCQLCLVKMVSEGSAVEILSHRNSSPTAESSSDFGLPVVSPLLRQL